MLKVFEEEIQKALRHVPYLSEAQRPIAAHELFRVLYAKSMALDPMRLSLPPLLDQCWHALILETELYVRFCKQVFRNGKLLHHTQHTIDDAPLEKKKRIERMRAFYRTIFGNQLLPELWTQEGEEGEVQQGKRKRIEEEESRVFVVNINGGSTAYLFYGHMLVDELMSLIRAKEGHAIDMQRLIYQRKQLDGGITLDQAGIIDGKTIHLVLRLRGC